MRVTKPVSTRSILGYDSSIGVLTKGHTCHILVPLAIHFIPQAPLLINIVDVLSPDFAEVLTPGTAYTGGADFFLQEPYPCTSDSGSGDTHAADPLNTPPATLMEAMLLFFVGDGWASSRSNYPEPFDVGSPITKNRSAPPVLQLGLPQQGTNGYESSSCPRLTLTE